MAPEELENLLNHLGLQKVHVRPSRPDEILLCCPFHNDNNPSFAVSAVKEGHPCNCFAECYRGSLVGFVAKLGEVSLGEAEKIVRRYGDLDLPLAGRKPLIFDPPRTQERNTEWVAQSEFFRGSLQNLKGRWKKELIHFLTEDGREMDFRAFLRDPNCGWDQKKKALTFSWRDSHHQICGISFRQIVEPLHRGFSDGFKNPGDSLFFTKKRGNVLVVTEGPLDAVQVSWATGLWACAIGHASPSWAQCGLLASAATRLVLCLDDDPAGHRGAERARQRLGDRVEVVSAPVHKFGKDPSRTPPEALARYLLTRRHRRDITYRLKRGAAHG